MNNDKGLTKYPFKRRSKNRPGFRVCVRCKVEFPRESFSGKGKGSYRCNPCNKFHVNAIKKAHRLKAFEALGGLKCRCCQITTREFLTIDHINGGGNVFRKAHPGGDRIYPIVLGMKDPNTDFQVLCMNCNWAKGKYGICPHMKIAV